ncbi:MAG: DNA polymerase III subunit delta [Gammaproteobacteria bacterium]|nr:MAG: DNA polymerase III subunit delta [Gammaproteobacteria bacterium]
MSKTYCSYRKKREEILRINSDQLERNLQKNLAPVYLITGDEPLQWGEAADAVRENARQQGFTVREVLEVESGFNWSELAVQADSLSLFAEKKIIDLRLPSGKPGKEGSAAISSYCENPSPDSLLLITAPKLDKSQQGSKWYKSIDRAGVIVTIWPLDLDRLPGWIMQRMRAQDLNPSNEAVALLADRVEGNLLAADQEIRKLKMLSTSADISVDDVLVSVSDSSRYDIFEYVDTVLMQQDIRLFRVLANLRAGGIEPPVVLWALTREIRTLYRIAHAIKQGKNPEAVLDSMRVWKSRRPLLGKAARRKSPRFWQRCLVRCARVDRIIKGRSTGNAWDELLQLGVSMSG